MLFFHGTGVRRDLQVVDVKWLNVQVVMVGHRDKKESA